MSQALIFTAGLMTALSLLFSHGNCNGGVVAAFTMSKMNSLTFSNREGRTHLLSSTALPTTSDPAKGKKPKAILDSSGNPVKSKNSKKRKSKSNNKGPPKKKTQNSDKSRSPVNSTNGKKKRRQTLTSKFNENLPLTSLKLGSKISGVVAGISPFGAFIKTSYSLKPKIEGGYALLHISQIQDTLVDDVGKVLQVGQKLKNLRVISISYAKGEVNLSLRSPRPKRKELSEIEIGEMLYGKIRNLTPYGAFVDVGCKINLLLHKSRISNLKVENIGDFIKVGDKVNVRVISKDEEMKNLGGSMLDLDADKYLNKRQKKSEKKKLQSPKKSRDTTSEIVEKPDADAEKPDAEIFDDAMRDLGDIFKEE
eukprot:CAMPEP_0197832624 /NCGR_PEP_ID=MMETSP1437-20131217/15313_1 /TAXON_ID=49252 ORGANISM="Eucampia antarctica, Strain CCMP1452" /NCGR_SAMPLE_ID=MMETSP1437 /ASSEMBLY_ACC=CAM_ASM_001096 /LENGTH=365 /DNA_ID=CAMNT_0043436077 /DNA_START=114 /DNA_END=1211 /DNA_ORIENTATION=-